MWAFPNAWREVHNDLLVSSQEHMGVSEIRGCLFRFPMNKGIALLGDLDQGSLIFVNPDIVWLCSCLQHRSASQKPIAYICRGWMT